VAFNDMNSTACILNVFSSDDPRTSFGLRREFQQFLSKLDACTVTGSGQSCTDPSYFDVEVRFRSESAGKRVIEALSADFSNRCTFDVDWLD